MKSLMKLFFLMVLLSLMLIKFSLNNFDTKDLGKANVILDIKLIKSSDRITLA